MTKYGHESRFFYLNWHFLTIYGHKSRDFFMKNGEKGYPIDQRKINKRINSMDNRIQQKLTNPILILKDIQRKK